MWTKVAAVAAATALAIKSTTPPNPNQPKAARVVDEGRVATLLVRWGWVLAAGLYVLAFLAYAYFAWLQQHHDTTTPPTMRLDEWDSGDVAALAAVVVGSALRVWCYRTLARHFTFSVTIHRDHELVQTGPYALLVHPSYTGAVLVQAGYLVLVARRLWDLQPWPVSLMRFDVAMLGLAVLSFRALRRRVLREEEALRAHFKRKWEAHVAQRKRFIPYLF